MIIRQLISDVHHLAFPPRCSACGGEGMEDEPALCAGCARELEILAATPMCPRCAMPVGSAGGNCPHCGGRGSFPFDRIVALAPFRDPLKNLIHQMKYHHRWPVAETLVDLLLEQERAKAVMQASQCIVAVPLHWSRQLARGYNQAQVIAGRLGKLCELPVIRPIVRVRNTATQIATHSRTEREENLRRAFGLMHPGKVRGKHIVLVDDVVTTASTLKSAARALSEGEPASISAIVLAVADPRGRDFQTI